MAISLSPGDIAHLHVLRHDDPQWERYRRVRDLLRADKAARDAYGVLKRELAGRFPAELRRPPAT